MRGIEWLRLTLFVCLITLLALAPAAAGQTDPGPDPVGLDGDGPWVVRVRTVDRDVIRDLAQWFDVWSVHPEKGFVLVQVDRGDVDRLVSDGFGVEVDPKRTVRLQEGIRAALARAEAELVPRAQTSGIPGFPCYRTVEETFASAAALATEHPGLHAVTA